MEARGLVISLRSRRFSRRAATPGERFVFHHEDAGQPYWIASESNSTRRHTDSIPIHNARFKSNWELSCARGIAVLDTLCEDYELPYDRFSVVGRADTVPVDSNQTPQGRPRNRRVDVVIVNSLHAKSDRPGPNL